MILLVRSLLVLGFCVGTLGAAGLTQNASPEPYAVTLFGGGTALLALAGLLARATRKSSAVGGEAARELRRGALQSLRNACSKARAIDGSAAVATPTDTRRALDDLLGGDLFDLTSRNEELASALGFQAYAQLWAGVAAAELGFSRAWSLLADGFEDEASNELPRARGHLERALDEGERVLAGE